MLNFTFQNPTKIIFGRDSIRNLGVELKAYGNRVLLVYGGGSIRRHGLYDTIIGILKAEGIDWQELSGVQPNPRITSVREGVRLCRDQNLQVILAVGGGSSLDCAKAIAAAYYYDGDPWDLVTRKALIRQALPVAAVLTLAATGSEMNVNTVISNDDTLEKYGVGSHFLYPRFSILDPTYTMTVPPEHTAAGIADIISHILEQYFSPTEACEVQDQMAEGFLRVCFTLGPQLMRDPENYDLRANILWVSTLALNGLLGTGRVTDWSCHGIEHVLSARYDITHGVGLAIITPHWMRRVLNEHTMPRLCRYARNVWQLQGEDSPELALAAIDRSAAFFAEIGLGLRLRDCGIEENSLSSMADQAMSNRSLGQFMPLQSEDVLAILRAAY